MFSSYFSMLIFGVLAQTEAKYPLTTWPQSISGFKQKCKADVILGHHTVDHVV